jgi:hypothetical protein
MDSRRSTHKRTSRSTRCGNLNKSQLRSQRTQPQQDYGMAFQRRYITGYLLDLAVGIPDLPLGMFNEAGSKH